MGHRAGHVHMKELVSHPNSVMHKGEVKSGIGGLTPNMSNGYAKGSREEEFKKGGHVGHHKK